MVFSQRHEKGIGAEAENFSLELNFPRDQRRVALRLLESSWRGWTTMSLCKVNHKWFLPEAEKFGTLMLVKIPSKTKNPISLCQYRFWFLEFHERAILSCFLVLGCCGVFSKTN